MPLPSRTVRCGTRKRFNIKSPIKCLSTQTLFTAKIVSGELADAHIFSSMRILEKIMTFVQMEIVNNKWKVLECAAALGNIAMVIVILVCFVTSNIQQVLK